MALTFRQAQKTDLPTLADLYRQTVLVNVPQYYTPEQTAAWAASLTESEQIQQFILSVTTYIAEEDGEIVGFAGIKEDGHVVSTYVRHDRLHQGIGSALMKTILAHAQRQGIQRLYAEASEFSLGLFQKFGFQLVGKEAVERGGIQFQRYQVENREVQQSASRFCTSED